MICSSGIGFDPVVDGAALQFRVAGIYNGVFTMWDATTGSAWSHLDGRAIAGPLAGTQLAVRPLQTTTWSAWVEAHPETTVPSKDTGASYIRNNALGNEFLSDRFLGSLVEIPDGRLAANALMIGVQAGNEARAFPLEARPDDAPMQDTVGGVPVVILEDTDGQPVLAYHRALSDGRVLNFTRDAEGGVRDVETGSGWSGDGLSLDGELAGVQLTFVTSFLTEYYGWLAFNPGTTIHGLDEAPR